MPLLPLGFVGGIIQNFAVISSVVVCVHSWYKQGASRLRSGSRRSYLCRCVKDRRVQSRTGGEDVTSAGADAERTRVSARAATSRYWRRRLYCGFHLPHQAVWHLSVDFSSTWKVTRVWYLMLMSLLHSILSAEGRRSRSEPVSSIAVVPLLFECSVPLTCRTSVQFSSVNLIPFRQLHDKIQTRITWTWMEKD